MITIVRTTWYLSLWIYLRSHTSGRREKAKIIQMSNSLAFFIFSKILLRHCGLKKCFIKSEADREFTTGLKASSLRSFDYLSWTESRTVICINIVPFTLTLFWRPWGLQSRISLTGQAPMCKKMARAWFQMTPTIFMFLEIYFFGTIDVSILCVILNNIFHVCQCELSSCWSNIAYLLINGAKINQCYFWWDSIKEQTCPLSSIAVPQIWDILKQWTKADMKLVWLNTQLSKKLKIFYRVLMKPALKL